MSVLVKGMEMPYSCTECPFVMRDTFLKYINEDSQEITCIYSCSYMPDEIEDGWIKHSVTVIKKN